MRFSRTLAAALTGLAILAGPAGADQLLGQGRIDGANRVVLPGGPILGTYAAGKFTAKPDAIQIQGTGSTGDVSGTSVTPSAAAPANSLASLLAGGTAIPSLAFTGGQNVLKSALTGNPRQTYSSLALMTNSAQPTTREFAAVFGLDASHGSAVTNAVNVAAGDADKGALFAGYYGRQGTINGFAANFTATAAPGNTSWKGLWGLEVDVENQAGHTGEIAGPGGMSTQPIARGLDITGTGAANAFRSTAAITIGAQQNPIWNRGLAISGTVQEDVGSYSNAVSMLRDWGSHTIGIDLSHGTYTQSALRIANQHVLEALRTDGTPAPLVSLNSANILSLGSSNVGGIAANAPFNAAQGLRAQIGTGAASTGQPSQTFAASVSNATNLSGQGGLFVKSQWATSSGTVFEAGVDVANGAYAPALQVKGDRKLYLWDGTAMTAVSIGPANSGPGNSGRALYLQ